MKFTKSISKIKLLYKIIYIYSKLYTQIWYNARRLKASFTVVKRFQKDNIKE